VLLAISGDQVSFNTTVGDAVLLKDNHSTNRNVLNTCLS
jgi:hypothetical protein